MTTPAPYPPIDGTQPCREEPEAFFFNGESRNNTLKVARAVEMCQACPFVRPCLAFALTHDVAGIWGATTDGERIRLRREHGIGSAPLIPGIARRDLSDEIRVLLDEGHDTAEIAELLDLDLKTVKTARHTLWYRETDYQRLRNAQPKEPTT